MLKAVFIDYTGTLAEEGGPDMMEVIRRVCQNSDIKDPRQAVKYWWEHLKKFEEESCGENFITEDQIVEKLLKTCEEEIHLRDSHEELHRLLQRFWVYAPAFPDTAEFFEKCPVPIYIISNNGYQYLEAAMEDKNLHPAGIICGDMVNAYKPHRELFEKALEVSRCTPEEAVHIGDSISSDITGALSAHILPILLNRKGKKSPDGIITVSTLTEALTHIKKLKSPVPE